MTISHVSELAKAQFINLTTFRKSGAAVVTPIWFAESAGRLYAFTSGESGKVKRLRANGRAQVAACDMRGVALGPQYEARVRILPPDQRQRVEGLVTQKYGLMKRAFDLLHTLSGAARKRVYLEIELTTIIEEAP